MEQIELYVKTRIGFEVVKCEFVYLIKALGNLVKNLVIIFYYLLTKI